ncbi:Nif3-like dinuclear metal center hexameric protein [Methanocella sp. CWC-04]|uniref:Nif3-like dinuclear metal center hexameric protein n=1 Tax=Methanooceanicella nereidis TaxID=2052831 RepID=A0AAP2RER8_9EURY|nr:Nif3-like dinuclear metal center hexameric protein [Methanocella sp. CWC-04]MCD1294842.1 Nif3-like dinuclear metal center hexameric protein [Methanocella sp. CWC-04]
MMLNELISVLENIAPPDMAEDFDAGKIGLIIKGTDTVNKVATALDPTTDVIKKAIEMDAQMLITHHTLIWSPVNKISVGLGNQLRLLLDNDMSLYSMHTNYDRAEGGVNDVLSGMLGLKSVQGAEMGRIGIVDEIPLREFAKHVSEKLGSPVEYTGNGKKRIKKVLVIGGSGFKEGLGIAKKLNADAIVSSELKHDIIRDSDNVALISAPHYHTEAPAMKALAERLSTFVPSVFIDDPPGIEVISCGDRDI